MFLQYSEPRVVTELSLDQARRKLPPNTELSRLAQLSRCTMSVAVVYSALDLEERSNRRPSALEVSILRAALQDDLNDLVDARGGKSARQVVVATAEQQVAEALARLNEAQTALNYAKLHLSSAETTIETLEESAARKRFILHPIRTVPPEILAKVSKTTLEKENGDSSIIILHYLRFKSETSRHGTDP